MGMALATSPAKTSAASSAGGQPLEPRGPHGGAKRDDVVATNSLMTASNSSSLDVKWRYNAAFGHAAAAAMSLMVTSA